MPEYIFIIAFVHAGSDNLRCAISSREEVLWVKLSGVVVLFACDPFSNGGNGPVYQMAKSTEPVRQEHSSLAVVDCLDASFGYIVSLKAVLVRVTFAHGPCVHRRSTEVAFDCGRHDVGELDAWVFDG